MYRILHVVLTTASLLACPYRCQTECHAQQDPSGTPVRDKHCCDKCADPTGNSDDSDQDQDQHEDCSCLCCAGGLPKSDIVVVAQSTAGDFVAPDDSQASATMCQKSTRGGWRAATPLRVPLAGRVLRSWIVSYVI